MALDARQQAIHLLRKSKKTLISARANPGTDSVASALAFCLWLKKMGKKAVAAIADWDAVKRQYKFLPGAELISGQLAPNSRLAVEFDLGGHAIRGLTYQTENGRLVINIMPDDSGMKLTAPLVKQAICEFDLIIALDAPDLETLGKIYDEYTELFYRTPIINIDNGADNEHYGELNLVDMTAVSTTEIIFNLFDNWQKEQIDPDIATCLLGGIIAESRLWQANNITPRSLACASELITRGGRREEITKHLFGNKSLGRMQLVGRILSRLRTEPENELVWSHLAGADFVETNTGESDVYSVIDDFFQHVPQAKITALLLPASASIKAVVVANQRGLDLRQVLSPLSAHGSRQMVECFIPAATAESAIASLKQIIAERTPHEEPMPKF